MRKFILCASLSLLGCQGFSQQTGKPGPVHDREFYLEKATKQKTTAWLFLAGGALSAGIGAAIGASSICFGCPNGATDGGASEVLAIVGGVLVAASIPFFISGAGNKKKAKNVSAFIRLKSCRFSSPTAYSNRSFPAVSLVIKL